jgi:hypothetical protein
VNERNLRKAAARLKTYFQGLMPDSKTTSLKNQAKGKVEGEAEIKVKVEENTNVLNSPDLHSHRFTLFGLSQP